MFFFVISDTIVGLSLSIYRWKARTVIGRTRPVTSPIWSRIDCLTDPKIRIVGLSFAELEMYKTVHLEFY